MIHVQVSPPEPFRARNRAEERMCVPFDVCIWRGHSIHDILQLRYIDREVLRLCSRPTHLIDLGSRRDRRGPRQWCIERDPLEQCSRPPRAVGADLGFAKRDAVRIGEMANHLMRRHSAPTSATVRAETVEAMDQRGFVGCVPECSHCLIPAFLPSRKPSQ